MKKLFIAGHRGMVGAALCRKFSSCPDFNLLTEVRSSLDLLDFTAVQQWFAFNKPEIVIIAAARVGGILANRDHSYEFLVDNVRISTNLIEACRVHGVKELIMLGSSCIYPKYAQQPIKESELLTGSLESTNEGYALAKICALRQCQYLHDRDGINSYSVMPPNLYGPNDNYDYKSSHVMASFIRKFSEAAAANLNSVSCWGTGSPRREFMHVDDLADAIAFLVQLSSTAQGSTTLKAKLGNQRFINVGADSDISIKELASKIAHATGYEGEVQWDSSVPDGTPRKLMDSSKMRSLGWSPSIPLEQGILETVKQYISDAVA